MKLSLSVMAVGASLALFRGAVAAELRFASCFSDNAVIQRDVSAPVWGFGDPGKVVELSLNGTAVAAAKVDANGRWKAKLPPQKAKAEPSSLTVACGNEKRSVANVLFGDVWLCGGQSNMTMAFGWANRVNGKDEALREGATLKAVRLLRVPERTSIRPATDAAVAWSDCGASAMNSFSAIGYFFGAKLNRELGIPIGLVQVCWSGSSAASWLPIERAERIKGLESRVRDRRSRIEAWLDGGREERAAKLAAFAKNGYPDPLPGAAEFRVDGSWTPCEMPFKYSGACQDFRGILWFVRDVELTEGQAAAPAMLCLGGISGDEESYVNGMRVGSCGDYRVNRAYAIPAGTLRAGRNTVALRVSNRIAGGFWAKPQGLQLVFTGGPASVPLAGARWFCLKGEKAPCVPSDPEAVDHSEVSSSYNGMISPMMPMAVRGAIWYQGCTNVGRDGQYRELLPAVIESWREGFVSPGGTDPFPFYIAQLASYVRTSDRPVESKWAALRWAQAEIALSTPRSGFVTLLDVGDHYNIHPHEKRIPAERLADLALAETYGRRDVALAVVPAAAKVSDGKVVVSFADHLTRKSDRVELVASGGAALVGFELADADGRFRRVDGVTAQGASAAIPIPDGMSPVRVRYAWDDFPAANLLGPGKMPVTPFDLTILK